LEECQQLGLLQDPAICEFHLTLGAGKGKGKAKRDKAAAAAEGATANGEDD